MRFDDMLATLLKQPTPTAPAREAAWRQIVDVLAQGRVSKAAPTDEAYDRLSALRPDVSAEAFAATVDSLVGRRMPPALFALFADEAPSIISPLIAGVVLDEDEWLEWLPRLSPTARGLLRHRRDLPATVTRALHSFGPSDFVIAPPEHVFVEAAEHAFVEPPEDALVEQVEQLLPEDVPAAPVSPVIEGERQIKDLLSRIAAFRARGTKPAEATRETDQPEEPGVEDFRFETSADGVIIWVEGAPRGPLIGETIAMAANGSDHGVDGHAAGAYRRRTPFRDARLLIAGESRIAGEWRISAVPFFEPRDGRFTGYRGTARRPRAGESATTAQPAGVFGTGIEADSLRQLVHELRTPLNAILGFSEMIERQYRGPAAADYRGKAADIVAQGRRMMTAIDDLDIAARVESHRLAIEHGAVDLSALLMRLHRDYLDGAKARGVDLAFRIETDLPPARTDPIAVERMFARLLAATIAIAAPGETMAVELKRGDHGMLRLHVARPRMLAGRDEHMLLDPGYNPEGDWPDAPVLGLGFALRLVRNLAAAAGGRLDIDERRFTLRLPLDEATSQAGESGA